MKTFIPFLRTGLFAINFLILISQVNAQTITEFSFRNPVLVAGVANQDGAVYKFSNVAPGIDANVTIIGRSGPEVILDTIDIAPGGGMGYEKALQPQLGIHGTAPANANWWMKFQVNFLKAGTNKATKIDDFVASAIDVDGDNLTIAENITMYQALAVTTSPSSVLTSPLPLPVICSKDNIASLSVDCPDCLGLGYKIKANGRLENCGKCNNTGKLFAACNHPWTGSDIFESGTAANALGIDTLAINNMATFSYVSTDQVVFSYGATTGAATSSAGQRLNSLWFKSFNYSLSSLLPLQLLNFSAAYQKGSVNLSWATTAEQNFSGFAVERSTDGKNYNACTTMLAKGDLVNRTNYTYNDQKMDYSTGLLYYRLQMVDKSGKVNYSQVKIVKLEDDKSTVSILAYPNPAKDQVLITMPTVWRGNKAVAEIYNAAGIMIKYIQLTNVNQTENLDISQLTRGFYTVNIICLNTNLQTKILKN